MAAASSKAESYRPIIGAEQGGECPGGPPQTLPVLGLSGTQFRHVSARGSSYSNPRSSLLTPKIPTISSLKFYLELHHSSHFPAKV